MSFKFEKNKFYSMPLVFGSTRLGSEIQVDKKTGKIEVDQFVHAINHTIVYESNPGQLEKLLPDKIILDKPYVIVTHRMNRNYRVLAGKGYNLVQVTIPVHFKGEKDNLKGLFMPVIWENKTDPIILGRELLGYCKIYAEIEDVTGLGDPLTAGASNWGFQFLNLKFNMQKPPDNKEELQSILHDPENKGEINYKYELKVGSLTEVDSDYFTLFPKNLEQKLPDNTGDVPEPSIRYGSGSIRWNHPDFEDMPLQYQIVRGLDDLEIKRVVGTVRSEYYHLGDLSTIRVIE